MSNKRNLVLDLTLMAAMTAILETAKLALNMVPNVELITLLVMVFTRHFGWKLTLPSVIAFILIEMTWWGAGIWVASYFFVWPLWICITNLTKKIVSPFSNALMAAGFGLSFGFLCAIITFMVGGWKMAFAWWISGIPFDIIHCVSNFIVCMLLYKPVMRALEKIVKKE